MADIASALRAMGPLMIGGSAMEQLNDTQGQGDRGYALLMAALVDKAKENSLRGKTLVEIGRTDQGSSERLALLAAILGMRFVTVDPANRGASGRLLRRLNPAATTIAQKAETYLAEDPGPMDFVYIGGAMDSQYAEALGAKIPEGGLVAVDCTLPVGALEANGFEMVARTGESVLFKRI